MTTLWPGVKLLPDMLRIECRLPEMGLIEKAGGGTVNTDVPTIGVSKPASGPVSAPAGAVAVIVSTPGTRPVTRPVSETDATDGNEDVHDNEFVMSCTDPSEKSPVAESCCVMPGRSDIVDGEMVKLWSSGRTVSVDVALESGLRRPSPARRLKGVVAVIVLTPGVRPVASPVLDSEAADPDTAETAQVSSLVRFCDVPSEKSPVAVNCCVCPWTIDATDGVRDMEVSDGKGPSPPAVPGVAVPNTDAVIAAANRTGPIVVGRIRLKTHPPVSRFTLAPRHWSQAESLFPR